MASAQIHPGIRHTLWAVVAERSNSSNSDLDRGIVPRHRSIDRWFETAWRRFSFSATLIAWTERLNAHAQRIINRSIVNARILIDSFSRMRERLLLISTDMSTDTHTYRSALHTHTHRHKHLQIWSFSNMPLFRGPAASFYLGHRRHHLASTWIKAIFDSIVLPLYIS